VSAAFEALEKVRAAEADEALARPALAPEEKAGQSSGDFVILGDANYLVY
jgi:hypothetical protein